MTVNEQFLSIIIMILSGVLVGAVIDGTRVFVHALSPKSFLRKIGIGVELIVWVLLGALTFYILYLFKGGEWRLVDPIAQISGILLYESLFQPFFRFLGRLVLFIIIKPIYLIFKLIATIIGRFIYLILSIFMFITKPFRQILSKIFTILHNKIGRFIFKKT